MQDVIAIQQLAYRYAHNVDQRKYHDFVQVFTSDAQLILPTLRLDGLSAICDGISQIERFKRTLHHINNVLVNVQGDTATAEVCCVAGHVYDGDDGCERKLDWGIRYEDELRRTESGWRITIRRLNLIWTQDMPLSDLNTAMHH